ncbi:MAG TPA: CorA family divalent cation transporter [Sphingomonas sp.]|jgi:zinc transporter
MSGFAYRVDATRVERIEIDQSITCDRGELVWAHLSTGDDRARAWLSERAGLADHVVEALTAAETRPRCDQYEDGALVNLRGRSDDEMATADPLASVRIWATKGHVFSVTRKRLTALKEVERCVEGGRIHDPGDLIAEFATAITADLDPQVADLGDRLDACEESLNSGKIFELRQTVNRVRSEAIGYRRFLNPQRAALEKLAGLPGQWIEPDDRQHLNAAADRAARMAEELEAIRERSALVHDALTDMRAEQLDQRGLVLSVAALVFLPLTFITGLYGMNVEGLWFASRPWAFDAIVAFCLVVAAAITGWFLWRRWITR